MGGIKKVKRGGKRDGAGRKLKHGEPTKTLSYRVPVSKSDQIDSYIRAAILRFFDVVL